MNSKSLPTSIAQILWMSMWLLPHAFPEYLEAPPSKTWVYSLVGTDYDGYKMLPHYRSMGIPDEQFHFDILHDPSEPDLGVKASCLLLLSYSTTYGLPEIACQQSISACIEYQRHRLRASSACNGLKHKVVHGQAVTCRMRRLVVSTTKRSCSE